MSTCSERSAMAEASSLFLQSCSESRPLCARFMRTRRWRARGRRPGGRAERSSGIPEHVLPVPPFLDQCLEPPRALFVRACGTLGVDANERVAYRRRHEAAVAADVDDCALFERVPDLRALRPERI